MASETFVVDRIAELDRLGWEAWVACKGVHNRGAFPFPEDSRLLAEPRSSPAERVLARARREHRAVRVGRRWLESAVIRARPDVIHAHFGWAAVEAEAVARRHGIALVPSFHGADVMIWPPGVSAERRRAIYRPLFAAVPRVLAVSEHLAGKLRALGYAGAIDVVPSGTSLERFAFRGPRPDADPSRSRLLYVGRLVPYKGVDVLLDAFARLDPAHGARLEIVGGGPEGRGLRALARRLGVTDRVAFLGPMTPTQVVAAFQRSDVLVVPSRTGRNGQSEALGNVSKEGLAVGLALVATDNGGIPETVPPDHRAALVAAGDPGALHAGLEAVLWERHAWPTRAREGRRWIEAEFDWRLVAPRIAAIYEQVVAQRPRGAAVSRP